LATGNSGRGTLGLEQIFMVFFKAGLAFGGGTGILAYLEDELVTRRRLMDRTELLTLWSLGRIVPCGTMTAVTVALGYRFGGHLGVLASVIGVVLPGFVCTVALAAAYGAVAHGPALTYIGVTLMPASLALILVSALRMGREVFRPTLEPVLAVAGFVGAALLGINPALLLIAGGFIGAFLFRKPFLSSKPAVSSKPGAQP
jgi:chromate transporter